MSNRCYICDTIATKGAINVGKVTRWSHCRSHCHVFARRSKSGVLRAHHAEPLPGRSLHHPPALHLPEFSWPRVASSRRTSASMSSVSMSRCTRLGWSTCLHLDVESVLCIGRAPGRSRSRCPASSCTGIPRAWLQNPAAASQVVRPAIDDEAAQFAFVHGLLQIRARFSSDLRESLP